MKYFIKEVKPFKWLFVVSFTLIALSVVAQLMQPQILQHMISAIVNQDTDTLLNLAVRLLIVAVVGFVAGVLNTILASKVTQQVGANLRASIFNKVQTFSFTDIEKFHAGNLVVRLVNDTQQAQNLLMMLMQALTRIPILFVGSVTLAIITIPSLWWIIVLMIAIVGLVVVIAFGKMGPKFGRVQRFIERINTTAKENFIGMRVVKSFGQEEAQADKFNQLSDALTREIISVGYIFSLMMPVFFFIMHLAEAFIIYLVGFHMELTPEIAGATVSFVSYMTMVMMSLMIGGMMVSFASRATISLGRIQEVMDTESSMHEGQVDTPIEAGNLHFNNVSFTYPGSNDPVLRNINFEIEHGHTVGIIGKTGSGKTTLVQLMGRLFDPSEGSIEINGVALKDYKENTLHDAVSIVLQRPTLFSGTIADIMRQGKRDAREEDMVWASEVAQATEFITSDPDGFDKEVYQRGSNFSGGQKQRLSIARGVIRKPKVLVLDDSTSALDARSEKLVQDALRTELNDTTKVIVSQKISSILHADLILVLDHGHIVDQGTHTSLIETSQTYREIFMSQQGKDIEREDD